MGCIRWTKMAIITTLLFCALPVLAEVMDKEPTVSDIWHSAIIWSPIAFVGTILHPGLGAVVLVLAQYSAAHCSAFSEVIHPDMGPAILAEAGKEYVTQVFAANALFQGAFVCGCVIWVFWSRRLLSKLMGVIR